MADADTQIVTVSAAPTPAKYHAADPADARIVELWLDGLSKHTRRAYLADAAAFFAFVGKPLKTVTLDDLQEFGAELRTMPLGVGSRRRKLAAVKSLVKFGFTLGYLQFDAARPLRIPGAKDTLNERILEADQVKLLIAAGTKPRNHAILQLLYVGGLRVSELVDLKWKDAIARPGGGQLTIFGKGRKTRVVRLDGEKWQSIEQLRAGASSESPIFPGRRGGRLSESQVLRIVKAAARAAGITDAVSPHWLRHCHGSHALDNGAPIHLVQQTLGHTNVATTSRYLHARPNESSSKFL